MNLEFWHKNKPLDSAASDLARRCVVHGFVQEHPLGQTAWKKLFFDGASLFAGTSKRIEEHVLAEVYVRLDTGPDRYRLLGASAAVFYETINSGDPTLREATLGTGVADSFPFFTMDQFREYEPPIRVEIDELGGQIDESVPGDGDYWEDSPKLHFVATSLFALKGVPSPESWALRIGASVTSSEYGYLFDCGWTEWWKREGRPCPMP